MCFYTLVWNCAMVHTHTYMRHHTDSHEPPHPPFPTTHTAVPHAQTCLPSTNHLRGPSHCLWEQKITGMKRTLLGQTSACFRTDRQAKELPGMYKMGVIGVTSLSYLIMLWWWEGVLAHTHWTAERIAGGTIWIVWEILHFLKCVLGAPEALFRAYTQYIYTRKLPSLISGFRWKSMTYGAQASGLRSSHVR